jgi:hypothetical protein
MNKRLIRPRGAVKGKGMARGRCGKRDLTALNAGLRLIELNGEPQEFSVFVDLGRRRRCCDSAATTLGRIGGAGKRKAVQLWANAAKLAVASPGARSTRRARFRPI